MKATDLFLAFKDEIEALSNNPHIIISDDEILMILGYFDKLSTVPRSARAIGDEDISDIQVPSFLLGLIRPRFVSYDTKDWSFPDLVTDEMDDDLPSCEDSSEMNSICAKIAKKLKFNLVTTAVGTRTMEKDFSDMLNDMAFESKVPATYTYDNLPISVGDMSCLLGEEFFVKTFDQRKFVRKMFIKALSKTE